MPYFVYKVASPLHLEYLEAKQSYKDARALVRTLRQENPGKDVTQFRLVFAKDRAEAERLLSTPRDERVIGED